MKKVVGLILFCSVFTSNILAQDIADVTAKARFERSKTIYVSGGPSFAQGALGDYSSGLSLEAGFLKRLNKVLSIGGGLSYLAFKYDPDKTYPNYYDPDDDEPIVLSLKGGDVSLLSAGFNVKLNLIPVSDNSKFSVYAIGTPFVSYYKRTEVSGNGQLYLWNSGTSTYDFDKNDAWSANGNPPFPALAAQSKVTGGVYLGVGFELFPAGPVSVFAQATYGYTFPITFVSTSSYLHDEHINVGNTDLNQVVPNVRWYEDTPTLQRSYFNDKFPIVSKGFTALSLKLGVAYNF